MFVNCTGYLQQLTDIILFYLSPELEFHCLSLRYLTREIIVNSVLLPILSKLSDPDYINQVIIYLVGIEGFLCMS